MRLLSKINFSFLESKEFLSKIVEVEYVLANLRVKQEVLKYSFDNYNLFLAPLSN